MSEKKIIRQRLTYTGRVQGVGFRYRAKYAARFLGITGWARNESDGSVTVEAQGTLEKINEMMKLINDGPFIEISWIDRDTIPVKEDDPAFYVK